MLAAGLTVHKEHPVGQHHRMRVSATQRGRANSTWSFSRKDGRKRWMARAGAGLVQGCVRWPGSGGAPAWKGLWCRTKATGASGCRRSMRWPRCVGLSRARVPSPWRDRVVEDKETFRGNAAGRAGRRWPRWGWRKRRVAPLSRSRSSSTPKAWMSQVSAHNVPDDPGSP
jgi:hypothetical protein